jgi:hypothetical protein
MFDGVPLTALTPTALLGVFVLLVFLGGLVPWRVYKEKCKESDNWRKVAETERESRVTADAQTAELLELAKTTHSIVVALFGNKEERSRQSGEADVVSTPTRK